MEKVQQETGAVWKSTDNIRNVNLEAIILGIKKYVNHFQPGEQGYEYTGNWYRLSMKKEEMPVKNVTTSVEVKGAENVPTPVMEEEGNQVTSPLVGTFYLAPSPDAAPFVNIGDTVKKGQTLGIIEAMKLMNEIECEYDGVVADVLVKNGEMVEYGQPLFVIC